MALEESATAFGSSVEEEAGRPLEELEARIEPPAGAGDSCFLGAFADHGILVGTIGLGRRPGVKRRHVMDLRSVYVHPGWRTRGIGRMLLEAAVSYARGLKGVRHITLSVNAANMPARRLYRSLGFVCYGLEPAALYWDGVWHDEEYYMLVLDSPGPAARRRNS